MNDIRIGALAHASGFRHVHHESVGSTNADVLALGRDRLWLTAGEQVAGRGRRGRAWSSAPGNLYASLLLVDPAPARRAADLCFVAALAVSDAIIDAAPGSAPGIALKWPNDVLIGGAKVAGILVEATHRPDGLQAVVGCGINVAHHPSDTPYPACHLAQTDATTDVARLFAALSDAFCRRLAEWERGDGLPSIREAWLSRAAGKGRRIVVRLPEGDIDGIFEDLDVDGALILRDDAGRTRPISAGEIFFHGHTSISGVD